MKKKINLDREKISGEEIVSRMNFNQLLSNFPGFVKPPFYKTGWFITTVASVTILVGVTTLLLLNNPEKKTNTMEVTELSPPPASKIEKEEISYAEDTPCINPPNKKLDIPSTVYTVNAEEGATFTHLDSKIQIPENTFVDENGNTLSGEIELHYREFHDAADFLVSGIPMTYDSAGKEYTFESAGMVEIYGYQNGKPVSIAMDKSIHIELPPKDGSSRFNLYDLDSVNRKWNYRGKPELIEEMVDESTGESNTPYHIWNDQEDFTTSFTYSPEEYALQQTFSDIKEELAKASRVVEEYEKLAPEKPKTSQNNDRQFELDIDPSEFPELKSYQNLSFEVDANDKTFTEDVYEIGWEDVRLSERDKGYYMTLYKGSANRTFLVHPVFKGEDLKKAMATFEKNFSRYNKELDERKAKEDELNKKYEKQLAAWEKAQSAMKQRELEAEAQSKLNMENWQAQQQNDQVKNVVARAFNVTQFGTWNCDSPIQKPSGASIKASFANKKGENLNLKHVNLIEKNKNAVFTYDQAKFDKLKFNPKEQNVLVAFVEENKIAIFRPHEFSDINKSKHYTFKMDVIDVESLKLKHIKEMLNI